MSIKSISLNATRNKKRRASNHYRAIYQQLLNAYGKQHWWPSKTKFEMILGAILTQNTSWSNVEKAINMLKKNGYLSIRGVRNIKESKLSELIRSSGYHNSKAKKIKLFIESLDRLYSGSLSKLLSFPTQILRIKLLELYGIGPETADSIILYAAFRPIFVIDAYTKRIFSRIGLFNNNISYERAQQVFHKNIKPSAHIYNEYHALIVKHAKMHCRSRPICNTCSLNKLCLKRI